MTGLNFVTPGIYGLTPGVDFPAALVKGLLARYDTAPPEALARVTLYVNTARMQRRIVGLLQAEGARLLPRVGLVTHLGRAVDADLPPALSPLRRRLELRQMVARLLALEPDLAPQSAAFELANSLAALLDEMQGEGVQPEAIATLDVSDQSGHWARSQKFIDLVSHFVTRDSTEGMDPEARQRRIVQDLIARWQAAPPSDPVILAGSTGSRGTTALLMQAVTVLPQGAVILPGVDLQMPATIWRSLTTPAPQQDHPQYRFAILAERLGVEPAQIQGWTAAHAPSPRRNALVSLALRPAPVTDGWRRDGPDLGDLRAATTGLTLIEAADPKTEALSIALCLRHAVEDGRTAALITPDRMLTRRVAAALDRWGIEPDDSAGEPLRQTPVGRFIRHAAGLAGQALGAESLLILLKHPLTHAADGRNRHLLWTRELELHLRRHGPAFPDVDALMRWAEGMTRNGMDGTGVHDWAAWVAGNFLNHDTRGTAPLADHVDWLIALAEALHRGAVSDTAGSAELWTGDDGVEAAKVMADLVQQAPFGGDMDPGEFRLLVNALLGGEVRNAIRPDPRVMIWGTLEARVQGADLVILGGLNDGNWPELPEPDPWLNRRMRAEAGLLLPERRIGLAAHDFQQAIAAPEAVLSRAKRDGEAETVPSRWLNRIVNLLAGLPDQHGPDALSAMRARGAEWTRLATALDHPAAPLPPAMRPSPRPPLDHRPRELPVTAIEKLIRDPYAVYAERILRLRRLDPLRAQPEMRDRGIVLHKVMEAYIPSFAALPHGDRTRSLMALADTILKDDIPWPAARRLWLGRLARVAAAFVSAEAQRQAVATPVEGERKGALDLSASTFRITAKADRIDLGADGAIRLYDYKTGKPPSVAEQGIFAKQLLLESAIAERAGFEGVAPAPVHRAEYLSLNTALDVVAAPLADHPTDRVLAELGQLIAAFDQPETGYTAQPAPQKIRFESDFDHLSRRGEWDFDSPPEPEDVGQ